MRFFDDIREGTIELLLKDLKSQSNPKKIKHAIKTLMKYGLTQEEIEQRLSAIEDVKPEPKLIDNGFQGLSPTNPGYKKSNSGGTRTYYLSCNHLISATSSGLFGLTGKGYEGRRVWCEVCSQAREVIDTKKM